MKHVLITIPILLVGGTEMQTLQLCKVLTQLKYRVSICCYFEWEESVVRVFEEQGAEVILLKLSRSEGIIRLFHALLKKLNEITPEIVHVQYVAPGLVPIAAARAAGIKYVFGTVHQPGRVYELKARILLRIGASLCTAFFCVSRSSETSWFGDSALFSSDLFNDGRSHFTVYNAIDVDVMADADQSICSEPICKDLCRSSKVVVGFVGRLRWEKGLRVLIRAISEIVEDHPDLLLVIVGDGPQRFECQMYAESKGLAQHIYWAGMKPQEEVFKLYSIMHIVVVPSHFEGFGLVAAEAMATGTAVICSDVDGLSEIVIDGKNGFLFPEGDHRQLAEKLAFLLRQPTERRRAAAAAQQSILERFSLNRYKQDIEMIYSNCTKDNGKTGIFS